MSGNLKGETYGSQRRSRRSPWVHAIPLTRIALLLIPAPVSLLRTGLCFLRGLRLCLLTFLPKMVYCVIMRGSVGTACEDPGTPLGHRWRTHSFS